MILKALLVALVYYVASWCNFGIGIFHFNRPIIVGPLIGLVLGDLRTGIILGATFESVFLGVIAVGGVVPADATIGTAMGTAVAILSGANSNTALAIAVPVSMFGVALQQLTSGVILPMFVPKMDAYAQAGNSSAMTKMHWVMSLLYSLLQAVMVFFAVWLGAEAMKSVLNDIPQFIIHGFKAAGAMLPAVGFALLLNMLFDKKVFVFYFLGFALCIYLKLPSLAIAIIAVAFAISQYNNLNKSVKSTAASNGMSISNEKNDNDEEDFFDE